MSRYLKSFFLVVILMGLLTVSVAPVAGQSTIRVQSNTTEYKFGEHMTFRLTAQSVAPIKDVVLTYRYRYGEATVRRTPEFTPGLQIKAEYKERLHRGEIPPGTDVDYAWQITDEKGNTLTTETATLTYMDDRFQFQKLTQDKLSIFWYGADEAFGQRVMSSAQRALNRLQQSMGVELKDPVKLIVYQTKNDMQAALPSRGAVFDERVTTLGTVVSADTVLLLGQQEDLDATIAHELTHVVVGLAVKGPFGQVPAWLNEGLAMWNENEGDLRGKNKTALEDAIKTKELISIRSMTAPTGKPEQVNLWYGEAFSIVDYLLKNFGKDKMAELLATFKKGASYDDGLKKVYGFDQDELDNRWRQSLGVPPRTPAPGMPVTPGTPLTPQARQPEVPAAPTRVPTPSARVPIAPPAGPPENFAPRNVTAGLLLIGAAVLCLGVLGLAVLGTGAVVVMARRSKTKT